MKKLEKKIIIKGQLELITGLHIGGSSEQADIGGVDNIVIRNPITQEPFIPGSSLKGKIRSLLQLSRGEMRESQTGSDVCQLFGASEGRDEHKGKDGNPSRVLFRDAMLTKEWSSKLGDSEYTDMPFTEVKTENRIDRIKGSAEHPRQMERVPAGTHFEINLVVNVFEGDSQDQLLGVLKEGIQLLEDDYLGGSGSRGYGQVKLHIDWKSIELRDTNWYKNAV